MLECELYTFSPEEGADVHLYAVKEVYKPLGYNPQITYVENYLYRSWEDEKLNEDLKVCFVNVVA